MSSMLDRRAWMAGGLAALGLGLGRRGWAGDQVVALTARQFVFTPATVTVKAGQPVALELTTLDRAHGFKMPALGIRADVLPGAVTRVTLPALAPGRHVFLCDVFCGDAHEEMDGVIVAA